MTVFTNDHNHNDIMVTLCGCQGTNSEAHLQSLAHKLNNYHTAKHAHYYGQNFTSHPNCIIAIRLPCVTKFHYYSLLIMKKALAVYLLLTCNM